MKKFNYTALQEAGSETSGTIEAPSELDAINALRDQGLRPISISEAPAETSEQRAESSGANFFLASLLEERRENLDRKLAWSTLGALVSSGVPILQALTITSEALVLPKHRDLFLAVREVVRAGESMVPPLEGHIPSQELSLIQAGEEMGQLPQMLLTAAEIVSYSVPETGHGIPEGDLQFALVSGLAPLLDGHLNLLRALATISESARKDSKDRLAELAAALFEKVQAGRMFSEALAGYPAIFDKTCINLIKAGELSGWLEVTVARCREHMLGEYRRHGFLKA